jgi:hypothetical protein
MMKHAKVPLYVFRKALTSSSQLGSIVQSMGSQI